MCKVITWKYKFFALRSSIFFCQYLSNSIGHNPLLDDLIRFRNGHKLFCVHNYLGFRNIMIIRKKLIQQHRIHQFIVGSYVMKIEKSMIVRSIHENKCCAIPEQDKCYLYKTFSRVNKAALRK